MTGTNNNELPPTRFILAIFPSPPLINLTGENDKSIKMLLSKYFFYGNLVLFIWLAMKNESIKYGKNIFEDIFVWLPF